MRALSGHLLVLGLGASGEAVASYALARAFSGESVRVTVLDEHDDDAQRERAERVRRLGAEVALGSHEAVPADLVVASPGIPPHSALMRSAVATGAEIVSEIELAYRLSVSPWIAVTGTNGKTTTTSLIAHLLTEAGRVAVSVGNIGRPAIAAVDEAGPASVLVAEVSSFQLALTWRFRPRVAVLLNITEDHVDWHGSMEAYAADKTRVFANLGGEDCAVIDIDDAGSAPYAGIVRERGVRVCEVSLGRVPEGGAGLADGDLALDSNGRVTRLLSADELLIRGPHNISNALAAAAAAASIGVAPDEIAKGLRTFRPIEHRLEPVEVVRGAEWFNDSKATNPDAVNKALDAFDGTPLVLLLGGRNKGNDFRPLAARAADRCMAVIAFGEAGGEIASAFEGTGMEPIRAAGLADAVARAASSAVEGSAVLLSPACASFDEFDSYEHRGREFKRMVRSLAGEERG